MSTSPPNYPMIIWYPGECITFNLVKSSRVKGFTYRQDHEAVRQKNKRIAEKNRTTSLPISRNQEVMSEIWEDETMDDNFLIVRLIYNKNHPWIVAHHGIHVIYTGPLFIPIIDSGTKTLALFLQDSAHRGTQSINRKFYLTFASIAGSKAFLVAHNAMISEYNSKQTMATKKRKIDDVSCDGKIGGRYGEEGGSLKKKCHKTSGDKNVMKSAVGTNDVQDTNGKLTASEEKKYKMKMDLFEAEINLDDGFVETQDLFAEE